MSDRCEHNTHIDIECADCLALANDRLGERVRVLEDASITIIAAINDGRYADAIKGVKVLRGLIVNDWSAAMAHEKENGDG